MHSLPIHSALASFGMSGRVFHGPLLAAHRKFKLCSILERASNVSASIYPDVHIARTFEEICKDDRIELVVVNTPDPTHYDLAAMALEAGKHVVVEKPFTQTYAQARALIELARKHNRVLSVFHNRRWDGDFLTVQQVIREGRLGRLVSFESHFDRFRNHVREETWKEDPTTGTGTLFNLGSHMIDQILLLFGLPEAVFADIRIQRNGSRVDDSYDICMLYADIKVRTCGSYLVREPGPRYSLHGTEGSFLKWGLDPQEAALASGCPPTGDQWGQEREENWGLLHTGIKDRPFRGRFKSLPGCYPAYYDNIFRAVRQGDPLEVSAGQAGQVIRVIEACFESMRTRKVVALAPPSGTPLPTPAKP